MTPTCDLSTLPLEIRQPLAAALEHCENARGILASPPIGGQIAKARMSVGLTGRDLGAVCDSVSAWWNSFRAGGCAEGAGTGAGTHGTIRGEIVPQVVSVEVSLL